MTTYHQAAEYIKKYNHTRRASFRDVIVYLFLSLVH
jgi:hypothetical protein